MCEIRQIGNKRSARRRMARAERAAARRRERWLARNLPATTRSITARLARERLEGR